MSFVAMLRHSRLRHSLSKLLCLAILFRAMLPMGYMLDIGRLHHGSLGIVICTGLSPLAAHAKNPGDPQPKHDDNQICPFSSVLTLAVLGVLAAFIVQLGFVMMERPCRRIYLPAFFVTIAAWPRAPPVLA